MIHLLATALLVASPAPRDCGITDAQYEAMEEDENLLLQKSGPGLWIAGISFAATDLESAVAVHDEDFDEWGILVTFTPSGHGKFREAQACGVNMPMEISVDGRLISRPILREEVQGNVVKIEGGFDEQSAKALARNLVPSGS